MSRSQSPSRGIPPAHRPASSARATNARTTRRAIVTASAELFVERGYAATTIDAVAERAGVGRKTVFDAVGGKGALLKLAWDWAIAGDDEPLPMSERPAIQAILRERDAHRLVRMWVDMLLDVGERSSAMTQVVLAAADVDAEAAALRDLIRTETLAGATAFVEHLSAVGALRADLSVERAADACWALVNSLMLPLLTTARGWSVEAYGDWLVGVASAALLEPRIGSGVAGSAVVRVEHDAAGSRYDAYVDDRAAGRLSYHRSDRVVLLTRTEVYVERDQLGVADALVRRALDDVAAQDGVRAVALCHYVRWWLAQHPQLAAIVFDPAVD